jgi:hypothetical protein
MKSRASAKVVPFVFQVNITLVMLPLSDYWRNLKKLIPSSGSEMKAALLSVWQENETRVARYPLMFGVLFVIVASVLGLLQDNRGDAITGFLSGPR